MTKDTTKTKAPRAPKTPRTPKASPTPAVTVPTLGNDNIETPTAPVTPVTPAPATAPAKGEPTGKLGVMIALLRRTEGATVEQMMEATGWQKHSVRGAMSGSLKKKQGLTITSEKVDGKRIYRIAPAA